MIKGMYKLDQHELTLLTSDKKSSDKDKKSESKVSASRSDSKEKKKPITNATAIAEKDTPEREQTKRREPRGSESDEKNPKRRKMDSPTKQDIQKDVDLRTTLQKDVDLRSTLARPNKMDQGLSHGSPHGGPPSRGHSHPHNVSPHAMHPAFPSGRDLRDTIRPISPPSNHGRAGGAFPRGYTPTGPSSFGAQHPIPRLPPGTTTRHSREAHAGGGGNASQQQSPRSLEKQHNSRSASSRSGSSHTTPGSTHDQQNKQSQQPRDTPNQQSSNNLVKNEPSPNNVDSAQQNQNDPSVSGSSLLNANEPTEEQPMETEEWEEEPQIYPEPITPAQREQKYKARIARGLSNAVFLPSLVGYDLISQIQDKKKSLGTLISNNQISKDSENGDLNDTTTNQTTTNGYDSSQNTSSSVSVLNSNVCSLSGLKSLVPSLAVVVLSGFLNTNEVCFLNCPFPLCLFSICSPVFLFRESEWPSLRLLKLVLRHRFLKIFFNLLWKLIAIK